MARYLLQRDITPTQTFSFVVDSSLYYISSVLKQCGYSPASLRALYEASRSDLSYGLGNCGSVFCREKGGWLGQASDLTRGGSIKGTFSIATGTCLLGAIA